jgi:hypothetical protein
MDGHGSRFDVDFLPYRNEPEHEWFVCIGVPYGAHLWQVGDASSMNGCFKMGVTKAKEEPQTFRLRTITKPQFLPSDVIPIVKKALACSFARTSHEKSIG